jgi:hypothetical protein
LICIVIFTSNSFAQEYPVSKESFDELHQIWMEMVSYVGSLFHMAKESKVVEQKDKLYLLFVSMDRISCEAFTATQMLETEFIHAKENQISSNAMAAIYGIISGLIDHTKRGIAKNGELLSNCNDNVLIKQYKRANEHLFKIQQIAEKIDKELNIPKEIREMSEYIWGIIAP